MLNIDINHIIIIEVLTVVVLFVLLVFLSDVSNTVRKE